MLIDYLRFKKNDDGTFDTAANRDMLADGLTVYRPCHLCEGIPDRDVFEENGLDANLRNEVVAFLQSENQRMILFPKSTELYPDGSMNIYVHIRQSDIESDNPTPAFLKVRII